MSDFSQNLKDLRNEAGISQQALGEKFNVSQQAIYKYENGLAEPDIEMLKKLARYFNVSVDQLIGFTPPHTWKADADIPHLTSTELALIEAIRKLPPAAQEELTVFLRALK